MTWLLNGTGVYVDDDGFYRYDGRIDAETFHTAAARIHRNDGPALLNDLFYGGSLDLAAHPSVVPAIWSCADWPARNLEPGDWVHLFTVAGYTVDGEPAERREKPVKLYRGCHHDRRLGMSWTVSRGVAEWFAERDLGHGPGEIFEHVAAPHEVLAIIDGVVGRMEAEYVLDPSYLNDDNVTHERPIAPKGRVGDRLRKTRETIAALKPEKQ